jgi:ADP-heptose:LPS heptosyltransferase
MRVIGFNAGQRGDLIINTVACKAAKQKWPDCHLTFGIGKPYEDMALLFKNHPYIDDIHIWESYDEFTKGDMDYLLDMNFDHIFNPMPKIRNPNWFNETHQTVEVCKMHYLEPPDDLSCYLNPWFASDEKLDKTVCINPWTAHGPKNMLNDRWESIIQFLQNRGYRVIQLSSDNQETVGKALRTPPHTSYFEAVQILLKTKLLISLDGSMAWTCSAYQHPMLGLYGIHYQGQICSKSYQPINFNAGYLEAQHANDISMDAIFERLDKML